MAVCRTGENRRGQRMRKQGEAGAEWENTVRRAGWREVREGEVRRANMLAWTLKCIPGYLLGEPGGQHEL